MIDPVAEIGRIVRLDEITPGTWDMTITAPLNANHSLAGQFLHVRIGDAFLPFLRRPLSVGPCSGDTLRLIFTVKGRGTELLTRKKAGDSLDVIGPLGTPFKQLAAGQTALLVAGGIGVVPLLLLDDQIPADIPRRFLLGVRSASLLTVTDREIESRGILLSTDDGSKGYQGSVVDLLALQLDELGNIPVSVYSCGPGLMMGAVKDCCATRGVPAQVSLEVPMGCGVGACQSCAVLRADGNGYKLVCKDGPVFDAAEVDLTPGDLP